MDGPRRIPTVPLLLGLGGLVPFWALALLLVTNAAPTFDTTPDEVRWALAGYGAAIASFLGGIRWGLALRGGKSAALDFALSVVPSLAGWGCLALPGHGPLWGLAILIGALGPVDQDLVRRGSAPPWFGRLRLILSIGAALALVVGALR